MNKTYDLLVIGGGINGTAIARDAAGRGLSVVLCEKDDLARSYIFRQHEAHPRRIEVSRTIRVQTRKGIFKRTRGAFTICTSYYLAITFYLAL